MRRCATDGRQLRYGRMKYKGIIVAAASRTQSTDWCTVCIVFSKYALRVCSLYAGMSTHQGNDNVSATTDNSTLRRIVLPAVIHQTLQKGIEEAHIPHGRYSGAYIPFKGRHALGRDNSIVCDAWSVRRQSHTDSQLHSNIDLVAAGVKLYCSVCVCMCPTCSGSLPEKQRHDNHQEPRTADVVLFRTNSAQTRSRVKRDFSKA